MSRIEGNGSTRGRGGGGYRFSIRLVVVTSNYERPSGVDPSTGGRAVRLAGSDRIVKPPRVRPSIAISVVRRGAKT